MKQLTFSGYEKTTRTSIVTFSHFYYEMIEEIKSQIESSKEIDLCVGRITDTGVSISEPIHFFNLELIAGDKSISTLKAEYYGDHIGLDDSKLPIGKTFRFDNPFAEILISPRYVNLAEFFSFGERYESYGKFTSATKMMLINEFGNNIELHYKNDDGTFSVVCGMLLEVNKGNILMSDYLEILVGKDNKTVTSNQLFNRNKNHRFISENGYLCHAGPTNFKNTNLQDNAGVVLSDLNEVFGEKCVWGFLTERKEEVVL